jgi:dihydropyrimidinase
MALLIKNGEIITPDSRYVADIWCEGESITKIGHGLTVPEGVDATVIDATGKYIFPGFIDPHTHIFLPFMGTFAKDTYESASIAALCGGTTTLIDFCIPMRGDEPRDALALWDSKSEGQACCDYTYHMAVTRFDEGVEAQLREMVAQRGLQSFKVFLAYKGAFGVDDQELYKTLKLAKELGITVTAHCENADIVDQLQRALIGGGKTGPEWHEPSRPEVVEAEGTHHFCTMLEVTGATGYVVHLSCEEALRKAIDARLRGVNVYVETLIQYLLLDKSWAERPDFDGAKFVMSPPLRDRANQAALWNGLASGLVQTLATDHAPFDTTQKQMGKNDFTKIPNGIPALEDRVRMFYTHGVATGRIDIHRFVELCSTQAAKIFGMFPKKGAIQPGADADLVVYDPAYTGTISAKTHHMNIDYNPFEGWPVKGRCDAVTVRGNVQVIDGEFVGKKGIGQFLQRRRG